MLILPQLLLTVSLKETVLLLVKVITFLGQVKVLFCQAHGIDACEVAQEGEGGQHVAVGDLVAVHDGGSKINSHYHSLIGDDGENRTGGSESETDCERGI